MSEKLYGVDQFYSGDFAQILTGVYIVPFPAAFLYILAQKSR